MLGMCITRAAAEGPALPGWEQGGAGRRGPGSGGFLLMANSGSFWAQGAWNWIHSLAPEESWGGWDREVWDLAELGSGRAGISRAGITQGWDPQGWD